MSVVNRSNLLNELGFLILHSLNQGQNVSFSPLTILSNLNLLLHTSQSKEIIEQINSILCLSSNEKENNFQMISELITHVITCDPKFVSLNMTYGVFPLHLMTCSDYSKLPNIIRQKDDKTIKGINTTIANVTDNKIKNLLTDEHKNGITEFGVIHFKAPFLNLFNVSTTKIEDFHETSTKSTKIPMMKYGSMIMYNEDKNIGVRMMRHYFYGGVFYIVIMVPINRFGLEEIEKKMTFENYDHLVKTMRPVLGSLSIPKLNLDHTLDLKNTFKKLGLDFANCKESFSHQVHSVSISLNEFGSNLPTRNLLESEKRCKCLGGFTHPPEKQNILANEPFLISLNCSKDNYMVLLSRVLSPVSITDE